MSEQAQNEAGNEGRCVTDWLPKEGEMLDDYKIDDTLNRAASEYYGDYAVCRPRRQACRHADYITALEAKVHSLQVSKRSTSELYLDKSLHHLTPLRTKTESENETGKQRSAGSRPHGVQLFLRCLPRECDCLFLALACDLLHSFLLTCYDFILMI